MTTHAITAVRVDRETGRITHVLWGELTLDGIGYEVAPRPAPVIDVVNTLAAGDAVVTVFPIEGQRVAGPKVGLVVYPGGSEGIETISDDRHPGRTLLDLPRMEQE
jgi:hypothetical protein